MPDKLMYPKRTTADLTRAVRSYCARLPFIQAVQFAASLWEVSAEEALRRLTELPPATGRTDDNGLKPFA